MGLCFYITEREQRIMESIFAVVKSGKETFVLAQMKTVIGWRLCLYPAEFKAQQRS